MGLLGMISSIKDILEKVARTLITKEIQVITLSQSAFPYPLKSVINIVKSSPSNSTPAFGRERERGEEKVSNSREHCRHLSYRGKKLEIPPGASVILEMLQEQEARPSTSGAAVGKGRASKRKEFPVVENLTQTLLKIKLPKTVK